MSLVHETCLNLRESEQPTIPPEFCKQERDGPNKGPLASFAAINNKSDQGNDANSSVIPPKNVYPRLACKEKEEILKELTLPYPYHQWARRGILLFYFECHDETRKGTSDWAEINGRPSKNSVSRQLILAFCSIFFFPSSDERTRMYPHT